MLGFVNGFLSGFEFFRGFFLFLLSFGFFQVSFEFRVHPRVKNETRNQTRFCTGQVQIQVINVKIHLNSHPSVAKLTGYLKPELSSLLDLNGTALLRLGQSAPKHKFCRSPAPIWRII
jgi:hypothetical protein